MMKKPVVKFKINPTFVVRIIVDTLVSQYGFNRGWERYESEVQ